MPAERERMSPFFLMIKEEPMKMLELTACNNSKDVRWGGPLHLSARVPLGQRLGAGRFVAHEV